MSKIEIGSATDFSENKVKKVTVNGKAVLVIKTENGFCAVENQCAHMPLPLSGGKVEGNTITCPFHNSKFDLCTGENLDWVRGVLGVPIPKWSRGLVALGQKPQNITAYDVHEEDGTLYIEA